MQIVSFFLVISGVFCVNNALYYDLSWGFDNNTIYWPNAKTFNFTKKLAGYNKKFWYSANEFEAGEHGGTHFDAPYHFNKDGWKVGELPFTRLISKGALVDVSQLVPDTLNNFELLPIHLEDWERKNGPFESDTILLIKFGHSKHWTNREKYLGLIEDKLNFPGISESAAQWIVNRKKFYGVGVDTASVDPGNSTDFKAHQIFANAQLFNIENAKIVEKLPEKGFKLFVLPMKIEEGTGAPLRLVAEVN